MPVTLVDRLPLPNLKVYTTGSVCLLSIAVYYALSVTSDPNWRINATLQRQGAMADESDLKMVPPAQVVLANGTRNYTEQLIDVMSFMMQEPLCMWDRYNVINEGFDNHIAHHLQTDALIMEEIELPHEELPEDLFTDLEPITSLFRKLRLKTLINIAYCFLILFGYLIQRVVFGTLRVAEAQRVKDKFWNYVFYKFIFVFGVINVQYMDEVMLWCSWFTLVGFLHLLGQLCKDRYEYLYSSPNTARWAHVRLICLLAGILVASVALLAVAFAWGIPAGRDTFAFMAAECVLVLMSVLHVAARYVLQICEADVAGPVAYYTHLIFDSVSLIVELVHVVHMVIYSNMLVSMASLVLLMQLRHLLHELQARVRRHRLYTSLTTHMSQNYPMASKEEVEKNQDNCAICWEPMKEARKLPCSHLFHNSCLCQWVQQDASCPTCRRTLAAQGARGPPQLTAAGLQQAAPRPDEARLQPNHLFHFDGSRYVSWLPSFSVEVTRVRLDTRPLQPAQIDHLARQVQQMFPQYPLTVLAADIAATRSADLTLENILEGRLPLTAPQDVSPTTPEIPSLISEIIPPREAEAPAPERVHHEIVTDAHTDTETYDNAEPISTGTGFSRSAAERQLSLQRRKEMLIANARKRYLEKMNKRTDRPDPDAPTTSAHS